ncbi:Myosin-14 [Hibiscus syriacus]|uniref:Myosin-14 n=1 Tax=Hibiscus syriacus TaxID=106335 RepID=A0A6A2YAN2_HIBSY|nr:Myosin-14 [Hibiscus syriacus]
MFPRSTHETFAQKLYQTFKSHKRFSKPKLSCSDFTICHYAGDVTYQTELFLDKNKDYVVAEHQALLTASRCSFVCGLFPPLAQESSKSSKFSSIGSRFKGVMEAIRISCAGYPTKKPFVEFVDRFGLLAPEVLDGSSDEVAACKKLLEKVGLQGYQIGKTKVFLRAGQMDELDTRRSEVLGRSASIIQRKIRSYLARRSFIMLRRSALQIQSVCRGQLACKVYDDMRREAASLRIQRHLCMHLARKTLKELCSSAVSIQTFMRGMAARNELCLRRQTRAAIIIQSQCHKFLARLHYMKLKNVVIATQCAWRVSVARKELRKLKMAARETGALQAAKNKLEKQVEELTWRLQLEKRMRVDMEEAKTKENAKLQSALQDMQLQFRETKELLAKERDAARRVAEVVPVIQQVPVVDHMILEKLTSENEKLKAMVSSLEKKIGETEEKFEETNKVSEERHEEKFLDMESENQVLRQQTLLNTPVKKIVENLQIPVTPNLENGRHIDELNKLNEPQSVTPVKKVGIESNGKLQRSNLEIQHENVDALINCVAKDIGFSHGKPMIGSAIENEENNGHMSYWLSNTSALLFLLQKSLKASGANPSRKPPTPTSLFGRMTMSFRSSPSSNNLAVAATQAVVRKVEGKYPALLFKQQLAAYVEKIFGIIRDNLKKELSSLLSLCIQAPRTYKGGILRSGRSFGKDSPSTHWQGIIDSLNTLLSTLKENFVPPVLIQKIFTQTFSYINVQLFNSNGEYFKAGLAELELWNCQTKEEYAGSSWDELKHIRQAVGFLSKKDLNFLSFKSCPPDGNGYFLAVIHQKYRISYDEISDDHCPVLSVQQLYRICTLYWDDNYNTRSVSPDVISSMRVLMTEDSNDAVSSSFLLDDNSSIPVSVDHLSKSLQEKEFSEVKLADELLQNPAFEFLHE